MLHSLLILVSLFALGQPGSKPTAAAPPDSVQQTEPARKGDAGRTKADAGLVRKTWTVDGQERVGLVHVPEDAGKAAAPVVFGFHGHGGNARNAANSFKMHTLWPEAIVVYMEGLPTPGALTDPKGEKNGWQSREGLQGDRDLKFFDAVLASLKKDYKVDEKRVYAMGHSNGGGFTYLLWKTRPDVFAAFAPSGAFTIQAATLKPKPVMHIAGKNDELVKFPFQERTMEAVRKVDGCAEKGEKWAKDCTMYTSKTGTPVVTMEYDGGHKYPSEAPALIVKFFKEVGKPAPAMAEGTSGAEKK